MRTVYRRTPDEHTAIATLFHQFICHSEGGASGARPLHAQRQESHRQHSRGNIRQGEDSGEDCRNAGRRQEGRQRATGRQENRAAELREIPHGEIHQECE